jgi:hypothetical protein
MRLVATQAVLKNQKLGVWFVAFQAFLDSFMLFGMTECTIFLGVFTGELFELNAFLRVAGLAAFTEKRHVIHCYIKGCVGITMAFKAYLTGSKSEMRLICRDMAHGALRDSLDAVGQMLQMAVKARNFGLVLATVLLDIGRFAGVTFNAVCRLKLRRILLGKNCLGVDGSFL